ncbi:4991_t:CDS:2 [Ambispora gerdemannii]|uniref:4991_t:CDS:1 n=1 Tax=Ambispora gerdemannii TaxID=144530 RepID=A0A9N8YQA2_9GLOM|nr:4991_t:CDS:2 [Ambispora gerdemannii]
MENEFAESQPHNPLLLPPSLTISSITTTVTIPSTPTQRLQLSSPSSACIDDANSNDGKDIMLYLNNKNGVQIRELEADQELVDVENLSNTKMELAELLEAENKFQALADAATEIAEGFGKYATAMEKIHNIDSFDYDILPQVFQLNISEKTSTSSSSSLKKIRNRKRQRHNFSSDESDSSESSSQSRSPDKTSDSASESSSSDSSSSEKEIREWTLEERKKLNDLMIRFYKRRNRYSPPFSQVRMAKEIIEISKKDIGIKLEKLINSYLTCKVIPSRPRLLEAIELWVEREQRRMKRSRKMLRNNKDIVSALRKSGAL